MTFYVTAGSDGGNAGASFSGVVPASAPVPEPATMLMLASELVGLAGLRRFKK